MKRRPSSASLVAASASDLAVDQDGGGGGQVMAAIIIPGIAHGTLVVGVIPIGRGIIIGIIPMHSLPMGDIPIMP